MRTPLIATALLLLAPACPEPEADPDITYDDTAPNVRLVGVFAGMDLDLALVDDDSLEVERQYRGPHLEGTDPADEVPDIPQSQLCEIEIRFLGQADGVDWEMELQLENLDPTTLGVGTYDVVSPDAPVSPDALAVEFQMEREDAQWERTALSGTLELIELSFVETHPDNEDVKLGGHAGGTFVLEYGPGEVLEGAFWIPVTEDDISGEEC